MDKQTISFYLATESEQRKIVKAITEINSQSTTYGRLMSCTFEMDNYFVEVLNADMVLSSHDEYYIYPVIRFDQVVDGRVYPKSLAETLRKRIAQGQMLGEIQYPDMQRSGASTKELLNRYMQVDMSSVSHTILDLIVDQHDVGHLVIKPTGALGDSLREVLNQEVRFGARGLADKTMENGTVVSHIKDIVTWDFMNVNRRGEEYPCNFVDDKLTQRELIDRVLNKPAEAYIKSSWLTVRLVPKNWKFPTRIVNDVELFIPLLDARRRQLDLADSQSNERTVNLDTYVDYIPGTWEGSNEDCGYDFVVYESGKPVGIEVDGETIYRWDNPLKLASTLLEKRYFGTSYEVDPSRHFTLDDYLEWILFEVQNAR